MENIKPHTAGLALGLLIGGWHFLWAALVALGWAQAVINFIFWLHFIKPIYLIEPFSASTALMLVGITAIGGFVIGYVFGLLWNWLHKQPA